MIEKDVANNVLKMARRYLDGQLKSVEGPAVVAEFHDYSLDENGLITEMVHYGSPLGISHTEAGRCGVMRKWGQRSR